MARQEGEPFAPGTVAVFSEPGDSPFTRERLSRIFQVSHKFPDRLSARESTDLEFKKSFNWASLAGYMRTCAAFANTKGGYIVFGVDDKPRKMLGLKDQRFEDLDEALLTGHFNDHFSPEVRWIPYLHYFRNLRFGLLHVQESLDKPVLCTKDGGNKQELKDGEIYYRYRGRTEKIRYPELRSIIDERRDREQRIWLAHLRRIARIGVRDTAILDLATGEGAGTGGMFVIDESLLDKLSFIREGEFDELKGAPAIKLVGTAEAVHSGLVLPTKKIYRTRAIRTPDIVHAFLDGIHVEEPLEYVRQICFESSALLPVYHFLAQATISVNDAISMLEKVLSTSPSKRRLIKRLTSGQDQSLAVPVGERPATHQRFEHRAALIEQKVTYDGTGTDLNGLLRAIRTLKAGDADLKYLTSLVSNWFDLFYGKSIPNLSDDLRRAICHLDEIVNKPLVEQEPDGQK